MAIEQIRACQLGRGSCGGRAEHVFAGLMAVVHHRLEGHGAGRRRQRKFEQQKNVVQLQKNKMIVANRNVQPA